jgi:peptidoglycan/xylan/chitin deacetylase (PgdA/CDA1 family)
VLAEIAPWPGGNQSAFVLTEDVESHFANAVSLAAVVRDRAVPATFFVVSQIAAEHPGLADSLAEVGEIGSHTSDHAAVAGRSYVDQRARLSRSQAELRGWAGSNARGLSPPEERFDEATLEAWAWTGGQYLVAVNEARSGSPEVFETPDGNIVVLPRIIKDDYNVFVQDGAMRSRRLIDAYLEGLAKVNALGALAVVSLRTQVAGERNRVQLIADVVDSARARGDWWFATGHDAASWWLARRASSVEVSEVRDGRLEVRVLADTAAGLQGAWLEVMLPGNPQDWIPRQGGTLLRYVRTEWGIRVPLPNIPPGGTSLIELLNVS